VSLIVATVFLGGWQIPFVSSESMRANIDVAAAATSGVAGIVLLGLGALMVKRYKKRYGDLRDYEVLALGVPSLCAGIALAVAASIFLWGPWTLTPDATGLFVFCAQIAVVLIKAFAMASVFIWVRWTLPRFRYDQLMRLGWKTLLPLGLANVAITAAILLLL
jgi:NADH-quinone oxidoreductase subunit H